jgi:hypothetical protein
MRNNAPVQAIQCPSCGEHFCKRRFGEHDVLVPRDPDCPAGNCPFGDRYRDEGSAGCRSPLPRRAVPASDCLHDLSARMHELSLLRMRSHDGIANEWPHGLPGTDGTERSNSAFAQHCAPCPISDIMQARGSRRHVANCSACGRTISSDAMCIAEFCQHCVNRGLG